jgi:hypothetical protein
VQRVDQPGDERRLGADDGQADVLALGQRDEPLDVVGGDGEGAGVGRDPRVARRAQQLGALRRAQQGADDRVLAPSAPDDEDLQSAAMKSSMGIADRVSKRAVPREPSSSDTRAIVVSSGASTMLTKS